MSLYGMCDQANGLEVEILSPRPYEVWALLIHRYSNGQIFRMFRPDNFHIFSDVQTFTRVCPVLTPSLVCLCDVV